MQLKPLPRDYPNVATEDLFIVPLPLIELLHVQSRNDALSLGSGRLALSEVGVHARRVFHQCPQEQPST